MLLLVLDGLLDAEEGGFKLSVFNLEDDCLVGSVERFLLRFDVCPLAKGRVPLLVY